MRPSADAWPSLPMTHETEPYGCEWRSDGTAAQSWPVATIRHCNSARRSTLRSQLTSLALLVDQAALADQITLIIPRRVEMIAVRRQWPFAVDIGRPARSEERRVGKEGR